MTSLPPRPADAVACVAPPSPPEFEDWILQSSTETFAEWRERATLAALAPGDGTSVGGPAGWRRGQCPVEATPPSASAVAGALLAICLGVGNVVLIETTYLWDHQVMLKSVFIWCAVMVVYTFSQRPLRRLLTFVTRRTPQGWWHREIA